MRSKSDYTLAQNCSTKFTTKYLMDTVETNKDVDSLIPSCSHFTADKTPSTKSQARQAKRHHSPKDGKDSKLHSSLPKSTSNEYNSRSERAFAGEVDLTCNRHTLHRRIQDSETDFERYTDRHHRSRCGCDKQWPDIHPVNDHFCEVLDYRMYLLVDKST